jgi:hypothetical protein
MRAECRGSDHEIRRRAAVGRAGRHAGERPDVRGHGQVGDALAGMRHFAETVMTQAAGR